MSDFEPTILAFCCNYCAYRAADLAGSSRMQYPVNTLIIRVPCSSKVDISYILKAFEIGIDGVFIAACLEGGCHFVEGNIHAKVRVNFTKELLKSIGFEEKRLEIFNLSASMGPRFVDIVKEMTERIIKLGPSPVNRKNHVQKTPDMHKREFLYRLLEALSQKKPKNSIPVPDELKEFGSVECNLSECIGCKKCMEICPEKAIDFTDEFDLPTILKDLSKSEGEKITKRYLLYKIIAKLANIQPFETFTIPKGMNEFYKFLYKPEKCVLCDKCSKICPENAIRIIRELPLLTIFNSLSLKHKEDSEVEKMIPIDLVEV